MQLKDLTERDVAGLLRGPGIRLNMGPFVLRLATPLKELVAPVHLLYANYTLADENALDDFDVKVAPWGLRQHLTRRDIWFFVDDAPMFSAFERRLALPMLEWLVNWCVFTRPNQYLILHSAVVERGGHAVILPGQPGAGKSTLCAGLSLRGWRLLSDEVAVMRPPSVDLIPVPRPIGLKEGSIDVIKQFEPGVVMGPPTPGTRKGTVAHIQVDADAVTRGNETALPRLIVFPSYRQGVGLQLEPFSKARTLLRVAQDAFNFSILGTTGFETLASLVDASDCYTIVYSDMEAAISTLNELIAREPTQARCEDYELTPALDRKAS
ncbi:MAG: HprK-related kinase A [Phycisphaeraceae bacterium]